MNFLFDDMLNWWTSVDMIITGHLRLRIWCFDNVFRKRYFEMIIFCFLFKKLFSLQVIFWKKDDLRRSLSEKIIFLLFFSVWHRVWAILRLNIYLNEWSPFCNGLFKLLLSSQIEGPMLAGLPWSLHYWPESDDINVGNITWFLSTLSLKR